MAAKTSPDYDPIEEALDIGYGVGRKEERGRQEKHTQRARRGGARTGAAAARRQAEEDRARRAKKTREANARMRANRALREEERTAAARRGAFRSGQANTRKAQEDAARQTRTVVSSSTGRPDSAGGGLSAPNVRPPGFSGGNFDRTATARVIVVAVALAGIGVVARDAIVGGTPAKTSVKVGNETVTVPTHLRSLGGVIIMGTVALIVNEFDPGIGLLFGVVLLIDVGLSTLTGNNGLFHRVGNGLFAPTYSAPGVDSALGRGAGGLVGPTAPGKKRTGTRSKVTVTDSGDGFV